MISTSTHRKHFNQYAHLNELYSDLLNTEAVVRIIARNSKKVLNQKLLFNTDRYQICEGVLGDARVSQSHDNHCELKINTVDFPGLMESIKKEGDRLKQASGVN